MTKRVYMRGWPERPTITAPCSAAAAASTALDPAPRLPEAGDLLRLVSRLVSRLAPRQRGLPLLGALPLARPRPTVLAVAAAGVTFQSLFQPSSSGFVALALALERCLCSPEGGQGAGGACARAAALIRLACQLGQHMVAVQLQAGRGRRRLGCGSVQLQWRRALRCAVQRVQRCAATGWPGTRQQGRAVSSSSGARRAHILICVRLVRPRAGRGKALQQAAHGRAGVLGEGACGGWRRGRQRQRAVQGEGYPWVGGGRFRVQARAEVAV